MNWQLHNSLPHALLPARRLARHHPQNPSLPRWAKPSSEDFVPFWLGEASVQVEVTSAEVGRDEVVRQYDRRTGR